MYSHIQSLTAEQQIETITKHLVGIPSINGTPGEVAVAEELYAILSTFPYFQQNPDHLWMQQIDNDPIGRKNVFAFVEGNAFTKKTIIYHSHIDTVGVEDFGQLKDKAFSPDELAEFFKTYDNDPDLQAEAQSGDWMFGRGSVDMKSGAAVHMVNVLHFSEHRDELQGNLLLLLNGDEESEHRGIIGALSELKRLQAEQGLDYTLAVNTDFITPLYDGDPHRYIYTGAAGKILPCFHIYGREVHVGDTLSGIDPNFIAAKMTEKLHNRYELAEKITGEMVLPPTCLYQRDTKDIYTVQTASSSHLYFNYFVYEDTPEQILGKLLNETKKVCQEAEAYLKAQFEQYIGFTGLPTRDLSWEIEVTTYEQYVNELAEQGIDVKSIIETAVRDKKSDDFREASFEIVSALQEADPAKKARVILFFAPPFLPHNYLKSTVARDVRIQDTVSGILQEMEAATGEKFALKKFFPYLADGSFLSIHETEDELFPLLNNLPEWETFFPIPYKAIQGLNIPSVNMGVYGKDGHKWTERLYKPYSFGVLPQLIRKATVKLLEEAAEEELLPA
ncbi:protein RocB [Sporosarcina sp. NCCP-2716]|uniref:M20/M25/M40 family metallo-hydrolase n=1 Tax=Sporosarcina sp. NCCP-2716 TaxID=2943679 RepID=UPI00203F67BD|nr:M20/M25/M40 family metallo-hydrolase [Sporosarcina sp. NCCP-2716]GKV69944.1 protein RocB [Sporosarcina sp. NCCP-2716]